MGRRERPVDPALGPLQAFAFDLRRLRAAAGAPSYRSMAQRAAFSPSALSAAARGSTLPSRRVTLAYVAACGGDTAAWARRWAELHAALAAPQPADQPGADAGSAAAAAPATALEPPPPSAAATAGPTTNPRPTATPTTNPNPNPTATAGPTVGSGAPAAGGPGQRPLPPPGYPVRDRLLAAVRQYWIEAVLQPAVAVTGRLPVRLAEYHGDRWTPAGPTVDGIQIAALFERSPQLLILGDRGTGKTVLLLELARDLLAGCARDPGQPVPVVVPLSSWAERRLPVDAWLTDELSRLYGVDADLARRWVTDRRVVPMLDGLSDVPPEHRAACVRAVNRYQHGRGAIYPLVVTCRTDVYESLPEPLRPRVTVALQPLTVATVQAHLRASGPRFAPVAAAVEQDDMLAELVTTPAFLAAAIQVLIPDPAAGSGPEPPTAAPVPALCAAFVARQLHRVPVPGLARDPGLGRFREEQVVHWLGWLAQTMQRRGQGVFDPDRLRVDMLSNPRHRWLVTAGGALAVGLVALLVAGVANGCAAYLYWAPAAPRQAAAAVGALSGLVAAALCGWGWLHDPEAGGGQPQSARTPRSRLLWRAGGCTAGGALLGLGFESWFGPVVDRPGQETLGLLALGVLGWFLDGLAGAATAEAVAGLLFGTATARSGAAGRPGGPDRAGDFDPAGAHRPRLLARTAGLAVAITACGLLLGMPLLCYVAVRVTRAALRSRLLRWLLAREGAMPLDYRRFLHGAYAAALLEETARGYRFANALLRRYFAETYRQRPASDPGS